MQNEDSKYLPGLAIILIILLFSSLIITGHYEIVGLLIRQILFGAFWQVIPYYG